MSIPGNTRDRRPLRPANFRANDGQFRDTYVAGGDVVFAWSYRVKDGRGRAAGEQLAGVPVGEGVPTRQGRFRVRVLDADGETVLRTIYVDDDAATTTYTNAQIITDFIFEPAEIVAELVNLDGTWQSEARRITITKRT
ncbi:MAG TPA: hypothetical protein VGN72_10030 [Tepidisphaeraceae bacterium]|jgi:hypothetical protein|nr:hypothetical protein [Tepidisphaeraceae bacterium]